MTDHKQSPPVYITTVVENLAAGEVFLKKADSPYTDPNSAAVAAAKATAHFAAATAKLALEASSTPGRSEDVRANLEKRAAAIRAVRERDGV
jgi:hypothetical protein